FSSRRRHTRWPRDWSSDVCSSDLEETQERNGKSREQPETPGKRLLAGQKAGRSGGCPHSSAHPHLPEGSQRTKKGKQVRGWPARSEEHTSELQSRGHLVCRLLLEK